MTKAESNEKGMEEAKAESVLVWLCNLCLDGAGGECHVPCCILFMKDAPRVPIRELTIKTEKHNKTVWAKARQEGFKEGHKVGFRRGLKEKGEIKLGKDWQCRRCKKWKTQAQDFCCE